MQELGMVGGRLTVAVEPQHVDDGGDHGLDRVRFLISTNPGMEPQPLEATASGGELSRISLAIQVATSGMGPAGTLIFDEVDVGIGGAVAQQVGTLLRLLGRSHQVLCVTHLAQVAAQAHHQVQVIKQTEAERARTTLVPLAAEQRVTEIARMLGGSTISHNTIAHAREMLDDAAEAD
jgi:DNA repair protein RecN (Recombination protein N)